VQRHEKRKLEKGKSKIVARPARPRTPAEGGLPG
jgi:hypothetical protein